MDRHTEVHQSYDQPFRQAAVDFFQKSGKTIDEVASELGIRTADLKSWNKKYNPVQAFKTGRGCTNVKRLRAENAALRHEVLQLRVQWDILKNTLGILSTTVSSREKYA